MQTLATQRLDTKGSMMTPKQAFQQAYRRARQQRANLDRHLRDVQSLSAQDVAGYGLRRIGQQTSEKVKKQLVTKAGDKILGRGKAKQPQRKAVAVQSEWKSKAKYPIILAVLTVGGLGYAFRKPIIRRIFKRST